MTRRRVAVIGAGASGLACIKCCLDEGLEPVCFESSDDIGGLWKFKENPESGHSGIYRSLVSNTSKEMMCYSDFPVPANFPNYMHNTQLLQYFHLYAAHFNLLQHIRFQTSVISVKQSRDFDCSGQWEVLTEDRGGLEEMHIFDAVLVCIGHYAKPVMPLKDFPGFETFEGQYCHSYQYKDPDPYKGKKVLVVGIGNSATDIASELSRVTTKTFLSTRRGAWIMSRMSYGGCPLDLTVVRRSIDLVSILLPGCVLNWIGEREANRKYHHRLYSLMPKHRFFDKRPIINDDLPGSILLGALVIKPDIREFKGSTVVFEDGTIEEQIDAVVFCTGYTYNFPFLPSSIFSESDHALNLYNHIFPPSLKHPTLGVIGLIEPWGPVIPVVEMQARWVTRAIAGVIHLPASETMMKVVEKDRKRNIKRYNHPKYADLQVEYIPYIDKLAHQLGVRPNLPWLLLTDPRLGLRIIFGPCTPYQYRLRGPGKWAGARSAILTVWDRVEQPMMTRAVPERRPSRPPVFLPLFGVTVVIAALYAASRFGILSPPRSLKF